MVQGYSISSHIWTTTWESWMLAWWRRSDSILSLHYSVGTGDFLLLPCSHDSAINQYSNKHRTRLNNLQDLLSSAHDTEFIPFQSFFLFTYSLWFNLVEKALQNRWCRTDFHFWWYFDHVQWILRHTDVCTDPGYVMQGHNNFQMFYQPVVSSSSSFSIASNTVLTVFTALHVHDCPRLWPSFNMSILSKFYMFPVSFARVLFLMPRMRYQSINACLNLLVFAFCQRGSAPHGLPVINKAKLSSVSQVQASL